MQAAGPCGRIGSQHSVSAARTGTRNKKKENPKKNLTNEEQEKVVGGAYTFETRPFTAEEREYYGMEGKILLIYKDGVYYAKSPYHSEEELRALKNRWLEQEQWEHEL